ncbi:MAG: septum formation initiator family protein [Pseudomonadota bacterium]|nr:septum formation initiator family protein [Pseudomonadota bacterium]
MAYLAYGAVAGAAGYRSLHELRAERDAKAAEVAAIKERRKTLELRADLLNPKSLDPDMVDERVRAVLGYANKDDIVIPRAELDRVLKSKKTPAE